MSKKQDIGVIGMGVMGRNLAFNIESKGYNVAIYNRSSDKTNEIIINNLKKKLYPYFSLEKLAGSLRKPRMIVLMITSGQCIDSLIQSLSSSLEEGDIIIDGGNSFYKDTIRRGIELLEKKIDFVGLGISGGQEGALKGPSLMPGGTRTAYNVIAPILKKISARVGNESCVEYIGPDGSGHYVKMIHNGIEYGDMQIIAEVYYLLKKIFFLDAEKLKVIFNDWNKGELSSYLMDITSHIITKRDHENNYILDYILDVAKSKGTGSWSSKSALDLGLPSTMIAESVFARYLSTLKKQRVHNSKTFLGPDKVLNFSIEEVDAFIEKIRRALYLGKIILYAQGFYQLKISSMKYNWNLDCKKIANIFRSGCIIRSSFLERIIDIFSGNPEIENLLLAPYCITIANSYQQDLRDVVAFGIKYGIPMPVLSSAISYYDGYRSIVLPTNLIQAQRDYFGAHTYERTDRSGIFHTDWCDE